MNNADGTSWPASSDGASDGSVRFVAPSLHGRNVYLRPLGPEDYRALRSSDLSGELAVRWRFRGGTPSPEQWLRVTWDSVLAQFIIATTDRDEPVGITAIYRPNFQDQHAYVAAAAFQPRKRSPLMMFATALLLRYAFQCWNFHKLYMELPEFNLDQLRSGLDRVVMLEGRLRQHHYYDGRLWDQVILAVYRADWERRSGRILRAQEPRKPRVAKIRLPGTVRDDAAR